jgi:hypothetical protein
MYIAGKQLKMPTLCSSCARDQAPCSGLPGQRCGRCRFKKKWCSHSNKSRRPSEQQDTAEAETDAETDAGEDSQTSPVAVKAKSRSRRVRTPTKAKGAARRKSNGSRVRFSA